MTEVVRLLQKAAYFPLFVNKNGIIKNDMNTLEFMEDNDFHIKSRRLLGNPSIPSLIKFLIKNGIVKTEKQALFTVIGFILMIIFLTIWLANILLFNSNTPEFIEDRFGNKYTPEQYIEYLNKGQDPLSPNFTP